MVGIGLGLARHILRHDSKLTVVATSRTPENTRSAILDGQDESLSKKLRVLNIDVTQEDTIHSAREQVEKEFGSASIKCLFNLSGIVLRSSYSWLIYLVIPRENNHKSIIRRCPRNVQSQYTGSVVRHETFPPTFPSRVPSRDRTLPTGLQYYHIHVRSSRVYHRQQIGRMVLISFLKSRAKSNHENPGNGVGNGRIQGRGNRIPPGHSGNRSIRRNG